MKNSNSNQVRRQNLRCNYTKFQLEISIVFFICVLNFPRVSIFLPIFQLTHNVNVTFAKGPEMVRSDLTF